MNFPRICFLSALAACIFSACGNSEPTAEEIEQKGQEWLRKARVSLADADFGLARIYIDSLRERCPLALNAREEGIILLDSIDMIEAIEELHQAEFMANQQGLDYIARDSVDTNLDRAMMKVKFFQKKIRHDVANKKQH